MPLDPSKFQQKKPSTQEALRLAVEWSAIILASMLALLFLGWSIALQVHL
jgi:hypothetical protein